MNIHTSSHQTAHLLAIFSGLSGFAAADLIAPEISLVSPSAIRAVQGSALTGMNFTATNLNLGSGTAFNLGLTAGSFGTLPPNSSLSAGNTGTITATPNIGGLVAGQAMNFGIQATNVGWNAPVSASTPIAVVQNRLLTGTTTINAGRHMAGLQPLGSLTLNGGALTDSEATRISIASGGNAQLANGLRLTSATNFTFNGAAQTHNLQVAYYGPTGNYNITTALPGAGASNYTDASGGQHQEFGGAWKTSAQYGNVFGEKKVFTEENRSGWGSPAWRRPDRPYPGYYDPNDYIHNQELVNTAQSATFSPTRSSSNATGVSTSWELSRGSGALVNERINPLISGEIIQGSSLNLSGVTLNVTGTAVANRGISGNVIDLGRRMVGSADQLITRADTVTLYTSGSDANRTKLNLAGFNLNNSLGVTAEHVGNSAFTDGAHTASVQLTGNFTIDTATQGRVYQTVNAGAAITGEGLAGETVQSSLGLGYTWNNVQNNSLTARNLLVIESSGASGSRTAYTSVYQNFSTETHTNIGWTGDSVVLNSTYGPGLQSLGSRTVSAVAEGLAGENATATATFNATHASVANASFSLTHNGVAGGPLTDGNVITIADLGSGVFQQNVQIGGVTISGGQNLDYQLNYGGGSSLLQHGQNRTLQIDFIGNSAAVVAGGLSRISKADLNLSLSSSVNYNEIVNAWGGSGSVDSNVYGADLGTTNLQLVTRFDAPAASSGSSAVAVGTDFGINGLALGNTTANTSERFTQTTSMELLDSNTLASSKTVQVEFVKVSSADPALVAALEDDSQNAASRAGFYGGSGASEIAFVSDIVNLTGLDGVLQVVQVSYDATGVNDEGAAQLLWRYDYTGEGGSAQVAWINSVLGNSNITDLDLTAGTLSVGGGSETIQDYLDGTRFTGSYAEYLADNSLTNPQLGVWGLDADANKVWAVIDHNSSFAVSVPEPSMSIMLLVGFGCLTLRRRKN